MVPCVGKRPTEAGFGDVNYSARAAQFRKGSAPAVLTGPCPAGAERGDRWLLCVDLDGGLTRQKAAAALGGALPPTLATHGGAHLWYWVAPSAERTQLKQWNGLLGVRREWSGEGKAPDLDLKGCGGYAVELDPAEFDCAKIADLPGTTLQKVLRAPGAGRATLLDDDAEQSAADLPPVGPLDADAETTLIEAAIGDWPDAGGGRHDASKALGGALRRAGVDRRSTERIAVAVQDGVDSDQPLVRIRGTLDAWDRTNRGESAFGLATLRALTGDSERISAALAAVARPSTALTAWLARRAQAGHAWARAALADSEDPDVGDIQWISAGELAKPVPDVEWLCERLGIPTGGRPCMFVARAGAGKTYSAQAVALAVASGSALFGELPCRQGAVRHIDNDQGQRATTMRYQWLAKGAGLDLAALPIGAAFFSVSLTKGEAVDPAACARLERAMSGVSLCVIDSLASIGGGLDENDSRFGTVLGALTTITQVTGTTWLVLHHAGKSEAAAAGRGTSAIRDRAGAVWVLQEGGHWSQDKISELASERSQPFRTEIEVSNVERRAVITIAESIAGETGAPTERERAAVAAYIDSEGGCGVKQIDMAMAYLGPKRAKGVLEVMRNDGQVQLDGIGAAARVYLTAEGRALLG